MKKLFVFTFVCMGFISCSGCKQSTETTNHKDTTGLSDEATSATTNDPNDIVIAGSNGVQRISVFSQNTNYDSKLSTVASEVRFIPLDNEPPINDFHIYDVELGVDFILLLHYSNIFQYDKQGHFIRKIGERGMGPADYINITPPLQIDNTEKTIYALDINRRRVVVYNFDGSFNRAFQTNFQGSMAIIDSSTIAFRQLSGDMFLENAPFISFTDRDGKNEKKYYSHLHPVVPRNEAKTIPEATFLWEHAGRFYYLEYGADTIFRILRDTFEPVWILTGVLKPDKKELFVIDKGKKLYNISYIFRPNAGIFESDRFLIFNLFGNQEKFFMVYDKVSGQFHRTYDKDAPVFVNSHGDSRLDNDYFLDDLVSGLHFKPQYQSMGKAISLIPAETVAEKRNEILRHIASHPSEESERLKSIVEKMDEYDNPLVMIVTFK
jgi:hypothetical protein